MNLGMSLTCSLRHELRHELTITGGATGSIFRVVDALLNDTEFQKALQFVASRKAMDRYMSMVDFLLCEVFTSHQPAAFAYYRDEGPQLRFLINETQRAFLELHLVHALHLAHDAFCDQRRESWQSFRKLVISRIAG